MSNFTVITDTEFEEEVFNVEKPVLVYFWAPWCGPCRLVSPAIVWIAEHYDNRLKVVKLEVDSNPEAVAKCDVKGVPALRLFKENKLLLNHEGAITKQKIQALLDPYLN